ncbi:hypothetical protein M3Y99_01543500 [Aphelenchoides fujianensis]|nr:hypothetical protein M3Y99_01543500 [Aphelenchoides fujianensis]
MVNTATVMYLIDLSGSLLGLPLNLLLILTIFKTSEKKLQSYSYLFLAGACFDAVFGVVEILTQHQLVITGGVFYVLPHWIEHDISPNAQLFTFFLHCFVVTHGCFILAALYRFRYLIITRGQVSPWELWKGLIVTSACSTVLGLSLPLGVWQAKGRGSAFYLAMINRSLFNENFDNYFLYVADIRDFGTSFFFYGSFVVLSACLSVSFFFGYKSWKFVGSSEVETINAFVFAIFPIGLVSLAMMFRVDAQAIGEGVMTPLSWLPTANAIMTLYCVKAYRNYVKYLLCFCTNRSLLKGGSEAAPAASKYQIPGPHSRVTPSVLA